MRIHYETAAGRQTRETTLENLGPAIDEIQRQLLAEGRVVVGIYVGEVFLEAEPQRLAEHLRQAEEQIEDLHLEARSVDDLARETAESAREYISRFLQHGPALVDDLYAGAAAPDRLAALFEGLNWLVQFLDTGLPAVKSAAVLEAGRALRGAVLRLADLDDVADTAFLADVLGYEIIPAVEALGRALEAATGGDVL